MGESSLGAPFFFAAIARTDPVDEKNPQTRPLHTAKEETGVKAQNMKLLPRPQITKPVKGLMTLFAALYF